MTTTPQQITAEKNSDRYKQFDVWPDNTIRFKVKRTTEKLNGQTMRITYMPVQISSKENAWTFPTCGLESYQKVKEYIQQRLLEYRARYNNSSIKALIVPDDKEAVRETVYNNLPQEELAKIAEGIK